MVAIAERQAGLRRLYEFFSARAISVTRCPNVVAVASGSSPASLHDSTMKPQLAAAELIGVNAASRLPGASGAATLPAIDPSEDSDVT